MVLVQVVLGSIAVQCPRNSLSLNALRHLDEAIAIYEQVQTANAGKVLPVLRKLRDRAIAATEESAESPPRSTPERDEERRRDNEELATLGGKTRLVSRKSNSQNSNPTSPNASGTASQKATSLSPITTPFPQFPAGQGTEYPLSQVAEHGHTVSSASPDGAQDAAHYGDPPYSQLSMPATTHLYHQSGQGLQGAAYSQPGMQPSGTTTYPLPEQQGFYQTLQQQQQQSLSVSPGSQRFQDPQPPQYAYGPPTQWTDASYGQTTASDQIPYATTGGLQHAQYASVNGQSQFQGTYNQAPNDFTHSNSQTFVPQEGQWQGGYSYSGASYPHQVQQNTFGPQEQYGEAPNYDANQALASGSYLMSSTSPDLTSPTTAVDQNAAWNALYSQWAPS